MPVVIYFFMASEGHLLVDRSVAARATDLLRQVVRDSIARGPGPCISVYYLLSTFWGHVLLRYQIFDMYYVSPVFLIPTCGTSRCGHVSFIWVFPFLCTTLCTLRGLDIYAIYFSPYYSPCGHLHFRCYSFPLFIYSELYIVPVLTCH